MSLYVDSSAILKRYLVEPESKRAEALLATAPVWMTVRLTTVEVRRNLFRRLQGSDLVSANSLFAADWSRMTIVEVDEALCKTAAEIAESTGARSLDAIQLAAARRIQSPSLQFLTFDIGQARAARSLGLTVIGV